jgi:hypothetical protein
VPALNKAALRREIQRERRTQHKARLQELRELITQARHARDAAIKAVQTTCAAKRIELRDQCRADKLAARAAGRSEVELRRGKLRTERAFEKKMKGYERPRALRSTSKERRAESDDEVRANLPADMVRVFDAVRKQIKGSPRKTRTEAFLEWAEENPGEVFEVMQHDADRYLAQLLAEQDQIQREQRGGRRRRSAVPF